LLAEQMKDVVAFIAIWPIDFTEVALGIDIHHQNQISHSRQFVGYIARDYCLANAALAIGYADNFHRASSKSKNVDVGGA